MKSMAGPEDVDAWLHGIAGCPRREPRPPQPPTRRFRAFLGHSPTFAWLKDEDGRYVHITERIREAVERGSPVTVSVGVATSGPFRRDADELVIAADRALYR
jgi:hypothetical protein